MDIATSTGPAQRRRLGNIPHDNSVPQTASPRLSNHLVVHRPPMPFNRPGDLTLDQIMENNTTPQGSESFSLSIVDTSLCHNDSESHSSVSHSSDSDLSDSPSSLHRLTTDAHNKQDEDTFSQQRRPSYETNPSSISRESQTHDIREFSASLQAASSKEAESTVHDSLSNLSTTTQPAQLAPAQSASKHTRFGDLQDKSVPPASTTGNSHHHSASPDRSISKGKTPSQPSVASSDTLDYSNYELRYRLIQPTEICDLRHDLLKSSLDEIFAEVGDTIGQYNFVKIEFRLWAVSHRLSRSLWKQTLDRHRPKDLERLREEIRKRVKNDIREYGLEGERRLFDVDVTPYLEDEDGQEETSSGEVGQSVEDQFSPFRSVGPS